MTQPSALMLSIGSESVVAWALVAFFNWGRPWRAALAATVGTIATHWAAWSAMLLLMDSINYAAATFIVEGTVILLESSAYRWIALLPWHHALVTSLVANTASFGLGLGLSVSGVT